MNDNDYRNSDAECSWVAEKFPAPDGFFRHRQGPIIDPVRLTAIPVNRLGSASCGNRPEQPATQNALCFQVLPAQGDFTFELVTEQPKSSSPALKTARSTIDVRTLTMSENEIADILSVADKGQVFTLRFTDGTEAELMDFWVRVGESGTRVCVATIVRSQAQSDASPGEAFCFALSEVADVQVSRVGFKYHR